MESIINRLVRKIGLHHLIVHFEITSREDLEEGFSTEVNIFEIVVFLIVDVGVCKSIIVFVVPF
jgi:hypothetical protein